MKLWMWITLAVVIAVAAAVVYAYYKPNPNAGDTTKLQRTVSSTEQHTLDTVTITGRNPDLTTDQVVALETADIKAMATNHMASGSHRITKTRSPVALPSGR